VLPTAAGLVGGVAGGALGAAAGPVGAVGGALGGAFLAGGATRKLQDEIVDTLGLDSPESRAKDIQAHPYVETAAELGTGLIGLSPGGAGTNIATRLASGAIMGGVDLAQQGIQKGFGNIDPTQALIAGGVGAALPRVRPWAEGAGESVAAGAGRFFGQTPRGMVQQVDTIGQGPDAAAAMAADQPPPSAGPAVNEGPTTPDNISRPAANIPGVQVGYGMTTPEAVGRPANLNYTPEEIQTTPPLTPEKIAARQAELAAKPAPPMRSERGNILAPQAAEIGTAKPPAALAGREEAPPPGEAPSPASEPPSTQAEGAPRPITEAPPETEAALAAMPRPLGAAAPEAGERTFAPAETMATKSKIGDALNNFAPIKQFRTAFTPEHLTEDTRRFENIVRGGQGATNQARLQYNQRMADLEKAINQTPAQARDEFAATFQTGVPKDNPLSRLSKDALDVHNDYQGRIKAVDPDGNWQTNFLTRMFADPEAAKNQVIDWDETGRRGPYTIGDFLQAGHKLRPDVLRSDGSVDPVQLMQRLNSGYDHFLEGKTIVNKAIADGIISDRPAPGMQPLTDITRGGAPLYATPEVATMANRYFNTEIKDPTSKSFIDTAQKVKNFGSMWQLFGGGYHMIAETTEAVVGDVMRAVQQAAAGRFTEAGKKLAGAPIAPLRQARQSATKALEAYYTPEKAAPDVRKAVDYLVQGSFSPERIARYTPEINTASRNFWEAWRKGALQMEMAEKGGRIQQAFGKGVLPGAQQVGTEMFRMLGEAMQTTMHPLFNVYIPRLKAGAALEQMMDYIAANPNAKPGQYQEIAKRILKSTDDRLGELNQSTLFWNNTLKRSANLLMFSPGWETGTLRTFFGGIKNLLTNPKSIRITDPNFQPNAAYPLAFAVTTAAVGGIYQFLKTGQPPQDVEDPFFPRTGGKAPRSQMPERAILPGYLKDVYSWWHGLTGNEGMTKNAASMLYNKLSLVPKTVWDTMADKDWSGHQIYNPSDPSYQKMGQYLQYVQRNAMPIFAQQLRTQQKGTDITAPEAAVGIRHAPSAILKPQQSEAGTRKANKKAQQESEKFHKRIGFAQGGVVKPFTNPFKRGSAHAVEQQKAT
jgi:hypothetical protein